MRSIFIMQSIKGPTRQHELLLAHTITQNIGNTLACWVDPDHEVGIGDDLFDQVFCIIYRLLSVITFVRTFSKVRF